MGKHKNGWKIKPLIQRVLGEISQVKNGVLAEGMGFEPT
jgi:hypothetical protein